jgi:serine/threonine protein kinase
MRHLTHPNNMRLYEIFESDNSLYIVFELLSGGSLHDKVKSKYKFKAHEVQQIIHGILLGMK